MGILQNISLHGCLNYTHYSTYMFKTDFLNIFILSTNLLSKKNFKKKKRKEMEGRRKAEGKKKKKKRRKKEEKKKRRKKERKKKGKKKRVETRLAGFCIFQPCNG